MDLKATSIAQVSAEMMTELALGMEDGAVIAQRYGFSVGEFATLVTQPWFIKALQSQQATVEEQGWTYRAKMAMFAEDLAFEVWAAAKASDSASVKLDAAKYFSKMADLEPKPNAQVEAGGGFSITINIPSIPQAESDKSDTAPASTSKLIDIKLNDELPALEGPAPFRVPDFDLSGHDDLSVLPAGFPEEPT